MKHGKRYNEAKKQVDPKKTYSPTEAIELTQKTSGVKFDAGVEVHIRLGIDPKKGEQQIRGSIVLPHGTGKTQKVVAFTDNPAEAKEAGADIIADDEFITKLKQTGKCDFDVAVATPDMMKKIAPIAKILGPKGLMPSPKDGTVTPNIKKAIEELKRGKANFKNDDTGNTHVLIGKVSFDKAKLLENYNTLMEAVLKAKPASSKGQYIKNISISSSMGPGIKVAL